MITKQKTYNAVAKHLFTQGEPAMGSVDDHPKAICMYRAEDGKRCAVGCLIPNDEYKEEFENKCAHTVRGGCPTLQEHDLELLEALQEVHDTYVDLELDADDEGFWEHCKMGLTGVAQEYYLNTKYMKSLGAKS